LVKVLGYASRNLILIQVLGLTVGKDMYNEQAKRYSCNIESELLEDVCTDTKTQIVQNQRV